MPAVLPRCTFAAPATPTRLLKRPSARAHNQTIHRIRAKHIKAFDPTEPRRPPMSVAAGGVAQQPPDVSGRPMTPEERKVIFASSLGTVFEWYDFYIYGTLGVFLAKYFFSNVPANVAFIFTLLAFAAGFAVRPFGALIFGRLGDMIGRKYTFLITMSLMGVGTFFIGVLPGYGSWGIAAPIVLVALRLIQGLALGGEYGGAAIYVAEHAPQDRRGFY